MLTVPFIIFIVKRLLPDRQFLPEVGTQASEQIPVPVVKKRMLVVATVFVVAIALTILDLKVLPKEIVPCAAALLLMLLGYVDIKPALASVDWSILLMVAGMTAVAKGIQKSGLIELIIHNVIQDISGMNLILVALIIYGMSGILTQFVTNSALSAMLLPLVIPFSASIGLSTHMAAAAVSIGCNLHPITYMAQARAAALKEYSGITMKEFVKIGLAYWVVAILSFILCVPYFMG